MPGTGNKNTNKHGAGEDIWKDEGARRANRTERRRSEENDQSCQDFWQLDPNADRVGIQTRK